MPITCTHHIVNTDPADIITDRTDDAEDSDFTIRVESIIFTRKFDLC